jgi:photosystem II stability/assembly factor-like uncharacterized protein
MTGLGQFPFIHVVNSQTAWVVGGVPGTPRVYKTTNGGANFVLSTGNMTGPELYAVCGISDQICIVGDGGPPIASIKRTTDGGTTWTTMVTTASGVGFWNGIARSFADPNFIFAESDAPSGTAHAIAISTNAGVSWTSSTANTGGGGIGAVASVYCIDNQFFGFGMSSTSRISYSTNGGTSWAFTNLSVTGTFTSGVAFNQNKMNGIFASSTSLPNISRSTTGPAGPMSTVNVGPPVTGICVMRYLPNSNICFLSGGTGTPGIKISTDNGTTWTNMTTAGLSGWNDISVTIDGANIIGYAIGADGSVIRLQTPTAIHQIGTEVPKNFALEQNYPNPFNPSTVVKYSVPKGVNVTMKVFNSIGQEIKTVVDEFHPAGNYQQIVDLDGFSSGVYFYTIIAGDFKETKKMLLVK